MDYYIETNINADFKTAINMLDESLMKEGFSIFSEVDLTDKLKERLSVSFRNYMILGAFHPVLILKGLNNKDKMGTLLPCTIIVQEKKPGNIEISAIDPVVTMVAETNNDLRSLAFLMKEKLSNVIEDIGEKGRDKDI